MDHHGTGDPVLERLPAGRHEHAEEADPEGERAGDVAEETEKRGEDPDRSSVDPQHANPEESHPRRLTGHAPEADAVERRKHEADHRERPRQCAAQMGPEPPPLRALGAPSRLEEGSGEDLPPDLLDDPAGDRDEQREHDHVAQQRERATDDPRVASGQDLPRSLRAQASTASSAANERPRIPSVSSSMALRLWPCTMRRTCSGWASRCAR